MIALEAPQLRRIVRLQQARWPVRSRVLETSHTGARNAERVPLPLVSFARLMHAPGLLPTCQSRAPDRRDCDGPILSLDPAQELVCIPRRPLRDEAKYAVPVR